MLRPLLLLALVCPILMPIFGAEDGDQAAAPAPNGEDAALMVAARSADAVFVRKLQLIFAHLAEGGIDEQISSIRELGRLGVPEAVPVLLGYADFTKKHPPGVMIAACESLGDLGDPLGIAMMQRLLDEKDAHVRAAAQKNLTRLEAMGGALHKGLADDTNDSIRASAATNLGTLKIEDAGDLLIRALRYDTRPHIRRMAAIGLGKLGSISAADPLQDALSDGDPGVRRYAAESLTRLNAVKSVPYLLMALEANVSSAHLNRAIMTLTGQDFGFDPTENAITRQAAVERGFVWWAANAKTLTGG